MTRRRILVWLVASALALPAADFVYWRWAANSLTCGIETWSEDRRAEGWQVETEPVTVGGWPNEVRVRIPSIRMAHSIGGPAGDLRIAIDGATVALALWHPTALSVALDGAQRITLPDRRAVVIREDRLVADMPLIGKVAGVATLHAQNPRMAAADDAWSSAADDIFAQVSMVGTEQGHPAADFTVTASAIVLPAGGKWPLGNLIRDIAVSGRVDGPFPPFRTAAAWVRDWRDGGGSLVVKEAMIAWGPLAMNATATIALDDQLQPMGSGSAKVSGFMEALDRLSAAGVLTRSAATVAKAMLSLLAGTAVGDAPAEVEVPLSLQYRTLSMRQVPLLRLSELDWPGL